MSFFARREARSSDATYFPIDDVSTVPIDQTGVLSIAPAYSAIKLISETLATLPLHAYSTDASGARRRIRLPSWLAQPADGSSTVDFVQRGAVSALTHGNAWAYETSTDPLGQAAGMTWLKPSLVTVDKSGVRPAYFYKGRPLNPAALMHIPAVVVPGSVLGVSPIKAFSLTFDAARSAQAASRDWTKNRAVPGLHLHNNQQTLLAADADVVADRLASKVRHGKPFVSGKDWDLDVLSIPPGDAGFLESIRATATTIASIFNLPPEIIGGTTGASLTYNTVEGQVNWLLMFTLRSWMSKFEAAFSARMPRPVRPLRGGCVRSGRYQDSLRGLPDAARDRLAEHR